jgi:hypothetical protein
MKIKRISTLILLGLIFPIYLSASDLDDGIALDNPINDDLQINKNVLYTIRRAKSKLKAKLKVKQKNPNNKRVIISGCNGVGNQTFIGTKFKTGTTIINASNNKDVSSFCE